MLDGSRECGREGHIEREHEQRPQHEAALGEADERVLARRGNVALLRVHHEVEEHDSKRYADREPKKQCPPELQDLRSDGTREVAHATPPAGPTRSRKMSSSDPSFDCLSAVSSL